MASSKDLAAYIYTTENLDRIAGDFDRYNIFNGKIREYISKAIIKEFKKPETVKELLKRIIPLNLMQKIVNKLAGVYRDQPVRSPKDDDEGDKESIDNLTEILEINTVMKNANRMTKLAKCSALEPYVSKKAPAVRVLPSHTFTQYSDDPVDPDKPTHTIKHLRFSNTQDKRNDRHVVWSDSEHYLMNGEGEKLEDYGNPYGVNPIVYIKEGMDLMPIQDDDLLYMQIAICLILTDLAFASKYLAWSVLYLIGVDDKNITFNPNSVITLPFPKSDQKPEIGTVTPSVDVDGLLRQIEALIGLLLTTKNLSIGTVSLKLGSDGAGAASGVAKILDSAESTEDQTDQQATYICAEIELWMKLAIMMEVWAKNNLIDASLVYRFSENFQLNIRFKDPAPKMSEKDQIETEDLRYKSGFGTKEMSLKNLYPEMDDAQIKKLKMQIDEDKSSDQTNQDNPNDVNNGDAASGSQGQSDIQPNQASSNNLQ